MANVALRQKAIDDLNDIWDYTYKMWSEKQADKLLNQFNFLLPIVPEN